MSKTVCAKAAPAEQRAASTPPASSLRRLAALREFADTAELFVSVREEIVHGHRAQFFEMAQDGRFQILHRRGMILVRAAERLRDNVIDHFEIAQVARGQL